MNEIANQLAQVLFKKDSLQECSRWELEVLVEKYPYFGIAHLMLAGKLNEENESVDNRQFRKTSLYFSNPLWLDYLLSHQSSPHPASGVTVLQEEAPAATITHGDYKAPVRDKLESAEVLSDITNEAVDIEQPVDDNPGSTNIADSLEEIKIAPLKIEPVPDDNAPLEFQAFHTVDYFASQGIKLKSDDQPKDRFGQQLKSFTEWLKTLKKAPSEEVEKQADKGTEQKVITLAEHSVEKREIVTETMAEVWAKQGNREKAIDVYNKLSLQNPSKSSYFASLIAQLKNT